MRNGLVTYLDGYVRYLDLCSKARDAVSLMKEDVRQLQSALRRSKGGKLSIEAILLLIFHLERKLRRLQSLLRHWNKWTANLGRHLSWSLTMTKSLLADECKVTEVVVNLLSLLDKSSVSYKCLFDIFRVAMSLKVSKCWKNELESLIGSKLDQATLDDLLVPYPQEKDYVYDVSFVLRLLKSFLLQGSCQSTLLGKVSRFMDLYAMEVAPHFYLKPFKFAALALDLPDSTRDSCDRIYQAMDIYLAVLFLCQTLFFYYF